MTREQLDAIRARVEAATPGPWEPSSDTLTWIHVEAHGLTVAECRTYLNRQHTDEQNDANAAFIAKAREDVPTLLAEVERLKVEVGRLTAELDMEDGNLQVAVQRLTTEVVAKTQQNVALIGQNGRLQLEVERLTAERDAAFKRGVAAMREAAARWFMAGMFRLGGGESIANIIRAIPDPEEKSRE